MKAQIKAQSLKSTYLAAAFLLFIAAFAVSAMAVDEPFTIGIQSPTNSTYIITSVLVSISANQSIDSLRYQVDDQNEETGCFNCSAYSQSVSFTEGQHRITAFGELGNVALNKTVFFAVALPDTEPDNSDFAIHINSPVHQTYDATHILLSFTSNVTVDEMSYQLDGNSAVEACTRCSLYNRTINVSEGTHTIKLIAKLDHVSKTKSISFHVVQPSATETSQTFTLSIQYPKNKTYTADSIPVQVQANTTLDSLEVYVGSGSEFLASCEDCSSISTHMHLGDGEYTFYARGILASNSKTMHVDFSASGNEQNDTDTDDDDNETEKNHTHRFDTGYENIPKLFEDGNISDHELADIILNNKLNPGVLNRLIKTGKLGNESLSAILDTQFQPKGIMRKLLEFIGLHLSKDDFASMIKEYYPLTKNLKQKLVQRDDLPETDRKQLRQELNDEIDEEMHSDQKSASENSSNEASQEDHQEDHQDDSQGDHGKLNNNKTNAEEKNDVKSKRVLQIGGQEKDDEEDDDWMPQGQAKKVNSENSGVTHDQEKRINAGDDSSEEED